MHSTPVHHGQHGGRTGRIRPQSGPGCDHGDQEDKHGERPEGVAQRCRPPGGPATHADAQEADDQHSILHVAEHWQFAAEPANKQQFEKEADDADEEEEPTGYQWRRCRVLIW